MAAISFVSSCLNSSLRTGSENVTSFCSRIVLWMSPESLHVLPAYPASSLVVVTKRLACSAYPASYMCPFSSGVRPSNLVALG
eukprot:10945727-Ditylum_brightwellii.AAC.1